MRRLRLAWATYGDTVLTDKKSWRMFPELAFLPRNALYLYEEHRILKLKVRFSMHSFGVPSPAPLDTDLLTSPLACFRNGTWLFVHMGGTIFRLLGWKFSIEDYNLLLPAYLLWKRLSVLETPILVAAALNPGVKAGALCTRTYPVSETGSWFSACGMKPYCPRWPWIPRLKWSSCSAFQSHWDHRYVPLPPSLQDSAPTKVLQFLHSSCPGWAVILMILGQILAARTPSRLQCREVGTGFNCALLNADQGRRLCSKYYICGKQPRI